MCSTFLRVTFPLDMKVISSPRIFFAGQGQTVGQSVPRALCQCARDSPAGGRTHTVAPIFMILLPFSRFMMRPRFPQFRGEMQLSGDETNYFSCSVPSEYCDQSPWQVGHHFSPFLFISGQHLIINLYATLCNETVVQLVICLTPPPSHTHRLINNSRLRAGGQQKSDLTPIGSFFFLSRQRCGGDSGSVPFTHPFWRAAQHQLRWCVSPSAFTFGLRITAEVDIRTHSKRNL